MRSTITDIYRRQDAGIRELRDYYLDPANDHIEDEYLNDWDLDDVEDEYLDDEGDGYD